MPITELMQHINRLEPEITPDERQHRRLIIAIIQQACEECIIGSQLQLFGSARLGVETAQSDIDAVCVIPAKVAEREFLEKVAKKLQSLCEVCRLVDAALPTLRLRIEGVAVDLLCACRISGEGFAAFAPAQFESVGWKAIVGCCEADALLAEVEKRVPVELFRQVLRGVRAWAKVRQIHSNAWGFLGNFSWALLTGICCMNFPQNREVSLENLLSHFFRMLSEYDGQNPLSLSEAGRQYRLKVPPDWLPVISSLEPCQNTARNVTKSTAEIIRREFRRATEINSWEMLFKPASLNLQSQQFIIINVTNVDSNFLEIAGWLEGQIIGLVIDLEKQINAFVRPWPGIDKKTNSIQVILGIDILPESQNQVTEIVNNFDNRFNSWDGRPTECRLEFKLSNQPL